MKTVFGIVFDQLGLASTRTLEQGRLRHRSWASPAHEVREVQAATIGIDQDHDKWWVGEIVALERRHGNLWAVGHVRDDVLPVTYVRVGDETVAVETDLYWSASRIGTEDYEDLIIDSISLTAHPARSSAKPVTFLDGQLDHRHVAAERWELRGFEHDLLQRAAVSHLDRRSGDPIYVGETPTRGDLYIRNDNPAEIAQFNEDYTYGRRPPGKLRHSVPYAGVLRVS